MKIAYQDGSVTLYHGDAPDTHQNHAAAPVQTGAAAMVP